MTKGTVQREQIYVYGTCPLCNETDVLVYEHEEQLVCAYDYRNLVRNVRHVTACDTCGSPNAVRDPSHRRNEYLCWQCHMQNGFVVNNTVIKRALVSMISNFRHGSKVLCEAAGYGSACDNNIKPRGAWGGKMLCNTHGKEAPKKDNKTKS